MSVSTSANQTLCTHSHIRLPARHDGDDGDENTTVGLRLHCNLISWGREVRVNLADASCCTANQSRVVSIHTLLIVGHFLTHMRSALERCDGTVRRIYCVRKNTSKYDKSSFGDNLKVSKIAVILLLMEEQSNDSRNHANLPIRQGEELLSRVLRNNGY